MPFRLAMNLTIALSASMPTLASEVKAAEVIISGTVVDENGEPASGAEVRVVGIWPSELAKTGADGVFELPIDVNAKNNIAFGTIFAKTEDGRLGVLSVSQDADRLAPVAVQLQPTKTLSIRVVDRLDRPVELAEVQVLVGLRPLTVGTTDADGRWSGRVPIEANSWEVVARKSNVGFDYAVPVNSRPNPHSQAKPLPDELDLKLDGAASIQVNVVDDAGRPLEGVRVIPWLLQKPGRDEDINLGGASNLWERSNTLGTARFDWVPDRLENRLAFLIRSESHSPPELPVIDISSGEREVTVRLRRLEGISGRVSHPDGRPASGVVVRAQGRGVVRESGRDQTKTDASGRYELKVMPDQAYIVAASDGELAAPYASHVIVRTGHAVTDLDFTLGPATKLQGRVTVDKNHQPLADTSINVYIDAGNIPEELRSLAHDKNRTFYGLTMVFGTRTDAEGRYEFFLGPGEYRIEGPPRSHAETIAVPKKNSPTKIVRDFHMERPESGPLTVTVLDRDRKPVAGASVTGYYFHRFDAVQYGYDWDRRPITTDDQGQLTTVRFLDDVLLYAVTEDRTLAGIALLGSEKETATLVVEPTATRTGRLLDPAGAPLAGHIIEYGISMPTTWDGNLYEQTALDGEVKTDEDGRFQITGLVPGENYKLSVRLTADGPFSSRIIRTVSPMKAQTVDMGEVKLDFVP